MPPLRPVLIQHHAIAEVVSPAPPLVLNPAAKLKEMAHILTRFFPNDDEEVDCEMVWILILLWLRGGGAAYEMEYILALPWLRVAGTAHETA